RIGRDHEALTVFDALLSVARREPDLRLPELFCGFSKAEFQDPVAYPVSCVPQAWAAGAVFEMLSACLGLEPDAQAMVLRVAGSAMPGGINRLLIKNLAVGTGGCDLLFTRTQRGVSCRVLSARGGLKVIVPPASYLGN